MNSFKKIRSINEAAASEYVIEPEGEETELAPTADGEIEFVDLHKAVEIAHPVADNAQFKSDKKHVDHKDAESEGADGEDKPVKQGTTGDAKFAQFRDKIGKTPTRKGDKSQGDMKVETVKEEVELDESVKAGMMKLKDGKSVKVSPDEAKMFNDVLKELNPENRKRMESEMMKDQKSYKSMLTFAKRTG
jgi:hypothetical protein